MSPDRPGQSDHDPGENDEADPVADAAFGDLLPEPHDEGGSGGEGDHHHEPEMPAGMRARSEGPSPPPLRSSAMAVMNDWNSVSTTVR